MKKVLMVAVLFGVMGFTVTFIQKYRRTFKSCRTSDDCAKDECCIIKGILGFRPGRCKKLEGEGRMCSSETAHFGFYGEKYWKYCPCKQGLSCEVDKPKKPLEKATVFDIYNVCLTKAEIEFSKDKEDEPEEGKSSMPQDHQHID